MPPPRGPPPPPRPVNELQSVAHRLSGAISQAFAELGLPVREVLTHVPWHYRGLRSLAVRISHMTPSEALHPNLLVIDPDEADDEAADEETREEDADTWDGAGGSGETANGGGRSDHDDGARGSTTDRALGGHA